jgi:hypothetical protein
VRAEFYRDTEGSKELVGTASWTGTGIVVDPNGEDARSILGEIFRATPVSVDDPSLRSFGTRGEVVLQPGSLRWFLAAARTRAQEKGLQVRVVVEEPSALGWDPAGAYRTFVSTAERLGVGPPNR